MTTIEHYADFITSVDAHQIDGRTLRIVELATADIIGCMVAGLTTGLGQIGSKFTRLRSGPRLSDESPGATGFGVDEKVHLANAAFQNALLATALDYEPLGPDGHIGAAIIPAALAAAEATGASGQEALVAIGLGLEIGGRIGASRRRGVRPDVAGTCHAAVGAAAAAARLLRLSTAQVANALGIAAYSAPVPSMKQMFEVAQEIPMTKYDHLALHAEVALEATLLAKLGFIGDRSVLDGEFGFWRITGNEHCDREVLAADLGYKWITGNLWFKRYPVVLFIQPVLKLYSQLVTEMGLGPSSVDRVVIEVDRGYHSSKRRTHVNSSLDAWVSVPYNVATFAKGVRPRYMWQHPSIYTDPEIRELAQKIDFGPLPLDSSQGVGWGNSRSKVTITRAGQTVVRENNQLTNPDPQEILEKCRENLGACLDERDSETMTTVLQHFGEIKDVRKFFAEWRSAVAAGATRW